MDWADGVGPDCRPSSPHETRSNLGPPSPTTLSPNDGVFFFAVCAPKLYSMLSYQLSNIRTLGFCWPTKLLTSIAYLRNVIETMPFGELVSKSAQDRYTSNWAGLIAYLINCTDLPEEKCRFGLSAKQRAQLVVYMQLLADADLYAAACRCRL